MRIEGEGLENHRYTATRDRLLGKVLAVDFQAA
jgi:hypothetical protein